MELWKDVAGFEGVYQVSNHGRVKRLDTEILFAGALSTQKGKILKPTKNSKNAMTVILCYRGKRKTYSVHRLVALAFIIRIPGLEVVNHIDGNPENNHEQNLEWCTHKHNQIHAYETGLKGHGAKSVMAKLNEEQVLEIRRMTLLRVKRKDIAKAFNVTSSTIKWIQYNRTWRRVQLSAEEVASLSEQNGKDLL